MYSTPRATAHRRFVRSFAVTFVRFISSGQGRETRKSELGRKEGEKEGREGREGRRGAQKILKGTTPDKGKTNLPSQQREREGVSSSRTHSAGPTVQDRAPGCEIERASN